MASDRSNVAAQHEQAPIGALLQRQSPTSQDSKHPKVLKAYGPAFINCKKTKLTHRFHGAHPIITALTVE
jgi:hypothetical protein